MKKFLTLFEVELRKNAFLMITAFIAITLISTWIFHWQISQGYQRMMSDMLHLNLSYEAFVEAHGYVSLVTINREVGAEGLHPVLFIFSFFLLMPILTFFLWKKEWSGRAKRIYFLLSLTGSRFKIFLMKALTVLLTAWLFYGVILLNFTIGAFIVTLMFPSEVIGQGMVAQYLQSSHWLIHLVLPHTIGQFLYHSVFILAIFATISAWFLSVKSFRWLGFIIGFIYSVGIFALYIYTQTLWLFSDERLLVDWAFAVGVFIANIALCYYLLQKKISV